MSASKRNSAHKGTPAAVPPSSAMPQGIVIHGQQVSSGPIPDAASLAAYEKVRANLPDIIIEEWQKEAAQRRELTRKNMELAEREVALRENAMRNTCQNDRLRLLLGACFIGGALFLAWELILAGKPEPAIIMTALPAVSAIISALIQFSKK